MLRSCYSTKARLCRGLDRKSDIYWYWSEGPCLPFPTAVNSLNWQDWSERKTQAGIGEVYGAKRPWRNGLPFFGTTQWGDAPWGQPQDFVQGGRLAAVPWDLDGYGLPLCCFSCGFTNVSAIHANVALSGFVTGNIEFGLLNGTYILGQFSDLDSCTWFFPDLPDWTGALSFAPGNLATLSFNTDTVPSYLLEYAATVPEPWDITAPLTFTLSTTVDPADGSVPGTLTVAWFTFCVTLDESQWLTDETGQPLYDENGDPILLEGQPGIWLTTSSGLPLYTELGGVLLVGPVPSPYLVDEAGSIVLTSSYLPLLIEGVGGTVLTTDGLDSLYTELGVNITIV